jgi:hypothetical protein
MNTITLIHQDRVAGLASLTRVWFAEHIESLPDGHPRKRFVCFMALYARDVLAGALPGPYSDDDGERFAAGCLTPSELLERPELDIRRAADALEIPARALRRAYEAYHNSATARPGQ